ncbi:MAG: helix-turn-helix domain-containing protein [Corallococcus sp.]|nr:helix-turn-helix domain-containing protein [Corallococcus sp.]
MDVKRRVIDWQKTGLKLKLLRCDNLNLRRYVCRQLSLGLKMRHICKAENCENCIFEVDNQISQAELAEVMNVSDSIITNWENGRTPPELEDLLFYADICKIDLFDIIVFK